MLTWELGSTTRPVTAPPGAHADEFLAAIVDAIGEPDFGRAAIASLHHAARIDFWSVYRLDAGAPPSMFVSGAVRGADVSADCFRRYRDGLHRNDRTFAGARRLAADGAAAMTLWNATEIPSPHRDQIYRRHAIRERLSVVGGDGAHGLLAVNLYRYENSGSYRDREIDAVQTLARGLFASVRKHIRLTAERAPAHPAAVPARLRALCPGLTARELEVCARLLKGWTYDGIAADLGLSPASVKTYRARAFERLGIHFRNELFALVHSGHAAS
jgi:DNA-binding CsgD family transcriptional regulator